MPGWNHLPRHFQEVFRIKAAKKTYDFVCKIEETLAMICLMGATLILCVGAVARAAGHPLAMINELALCLFAWCVFLGADTAYRRNKLVYVELIIDSVKPKFRRVLYAINYILNGAFLVFFIYESTLLIKHSWVRTWSSIPSLSYGWIALCMPVGCVLLLITTCIQFNKYVIKGEEKVSEESLLIEEALEENENN